MAKRTIEVFHDDLDGTEGAKTVKFGLDGKSYEIDLSGKNETALRKALEKYVDAATQVTSSPATSGRRKYGTGPVRRDTKHIREWLRDQGVEISDRGRIPTDLMKRYEAAMAGR
ncbi:histone-like nucleoid-structuring protein Lsr2 [Catenulispora rubra]|uniref:histone-like nucleoid-structuring protein Lsr2 n=1 Tax=Catenulispora rubra TaxID=280293 RepID=UPI0018927F35|nr:Lsr2 family protein [Catenulispora rubra]